MDSFYLLGDIHKDVLVSRVSLLQPSLAFYCSNLGNRSLQSYPWFGQVTNNIFLCYSTQLDHWNFLFLNNGDLRASHVMPCWIFWQLLEVSWICLWASFKHLAHVTRVYENKKPFKVSEVMFKMSSFLEKSQDIEYHIMEFMLLYVSNSCLWQMGHSHLRGGGHIGTLLAVLWKEKTRVARAIASIQ